MNPDIAAKFESYPQKPRKKLLHLRSLILETAKEKNITDLKECLKWEQPSYLCKSGSTVRIDWSDSSPDHYFMYFHCQTKLVETFRQIYPSIFKEPLINPMASLAFRYVYCQEAVSQECRLPFKILRHREWTYLKAPEGAASGASVLRCFSCEWNDHSLRKAPCLDAPVTRAETP